MPTSGDRALEGRHERRHRRYKSEGEGDARTNELWVGSTRDMDTAYGSWFHLFLAR